MSLSTCYCCMEAMGPAERTSVLQSMRSLAPLLWSTPYREPVLEGFIASIGGLDGRLRRSVSAAIAQQLSGATQLESLPPARTTNAKSLLHCWRSRLQFCCCVGQNVACFCRGLLAPALVPCSPSKGCGVYALSILKVVQSRHTLDS